MSPQLVGYSIPAEGPGHITGKIRSQRNTNLQDNRRTRANRNWNPAQWRASSNMRVLWFGPCTDGQPCTEQVHCNSDSLRAGRSADRIPVEARFSAPVLTCPQAHPASCTMNTGSLSKGESDRCAAFTIQLLSSAEVKERAELHFYSPSGSSWPVQGLNLPFFTFQTTTSHIHRQQSYTKTRTNWAILKSVSIRYSHVLRYYARLSYVRRTPLHLQVDT